MAGSGATRPRTVAVLLAGGVGARIGLGIPKQLLRVAGRPIVEHALIALHRHPGVDEILVMMATGHLDAVRAIVAAGDYPKVTAVLEGGTTRSETVVRALGQLDDDECRVLLHDAVRPLLTQRALGACLRGLDTHEAVDVVVPSADTVVEVTRRDGAEVITAVPQRSRLRRGQTPQGFRAGTLRAAYEKALLDPDFASTDECSVVLTYLPDVPVLAVPGDEQNMKVTEPVDVHVADRLFRLTDRDEARDGAASDAWRSGLAGRTVVVLGGSSGIGAAVARLAGEHGATVHAFSRSLTGTHVERRADVVAAAEAVLEATGRVDVVVNAAGLLPRGPLADADEETVLAATEVNFLAPVFLAQTFHRPLAATGGSMLLFTSSSYTRGRGGYALYSSAKAATVNLTRALADEWAADGIRVNCLNPERTATPMRTRAFGAEPAGTLLDADVVARAALDVVVSDDSGHVVDVRRDDPSY